MTICNLYGTIGQTILYSLYLYAVSTNAKMTVLACSLIRRFLQATSIPSHMSILVVSFDRFCLIVLNTTISHWTIIVLFTMLFVYAHGVNNVMELAFGIIGEGDMCGPTLVMQSTVKWIIQPVLPIAILLSLFMNIRILYFLHTYKRTKAKRNQYTNTELLDLKRIMLAFLIQTIVPVIFIFPQVVYLAMYNIDQNFRFSKRLWLVINAFFYMSFFLNPLVTVIFVQPFRVAIARTLGWSMMTSAVEQKSVAVNGAQ
ncbi:hypothetical protein Tcan_11896 [Toxocara canis]|uniref:G-protein coupled receptors family 1 profile domain-containing protein n=1 Tax=Toxocara canis TaxID=6265 RepID=A0A0B2VCS3_TOXCA|nr:hypothetical protein Tcan_11896 [Toxocara canis]